MRMSRNYTTCVHHVLIEQALSIGVAVVATLKPVFHCAYELLRCLLYLEICRFLRSRDDMYNDDNGKTDYFIPCARSWGLVKAHCQKFGPLG